MEEFVLKGAPRECPPAEHVYICVPTYTGEICAPTMHSVIGLATELLGLGVRVSTNFVAGCCYLDHTRNLCAHQFLETDATDLLFVDADVGLEPKAAAAIALHKRPLVAGIYPKKGDILQWPIDFGSFTFYLDADGLIKVPRLPTGFMRINRGVFDYMRERGNLARYRDLQCGEMVAYFHTEIRDGTYWGEDYQFCLDWSALGGEAYAMPDLNFSHTGPKTWKGNLLQWIRENATSAKVVPDGAPPADGTSSAA